MTDYMAHRINIISKIDDARAKVKNRQLHDSGFSNLNGVHLVDIYTIDRDLGTDQLERISSMLANDVFQEVRIDEPSAPEEFDYAVEVGFLPGVTDNVGTTAGQCIEDLLGIKIDGQGVYSSQLMFLSGHLSRDEAVRIGKSFANPLIQSIRVKSRNEFQEEGMGIVIPRVRIEEQPRADIVDILEADDEELQRIGKLGIFDHDEELTESEYSARTQSYAQDPLRLGDLFTDDGKYFVRVRRGPLAMDLLYMKSVQARFRKRGRNPKDLELESIAQTWSEHCKHTIFADPIDDIEEGLFRRFIKGATERIRAERGDDDFCVSVFVDNSGVIIFDENYLITDKVETHNTPSALDGYGGAATGSGGVIRDTTGAGLGAWPFLLGYFFCHTDPRVPMTLYRGENFTRPLEPRVKNLTDIIAGVRDYGNNSGIPTSQGGISIDPRYVGKPLVFVRSLGIMPKTSAGRSSHEKQAKPGDYVVMVGGRVGKDGVHGATFSSEALDSGSPATAVQIGDPITEKKTTDALIREARDRGLYNSITDNGAGGLSCSVAEMAKECGGCHVKLDDVPVKYPGLAPWEIWISESQERMTLAVPPEKWDEFSDLMQRRGVEATVIGEFTDSGRCAVDYGDERVMDLEMDFLHNGLPPRRMQTTFTRKNYDEPEISPLEDLTSSFHSMLGRLNIASWEFISQQFDHEVQGGSVIKPLQGRGRVNGDATVTRPVLDSDKGVVISQGICPAYGDIDTYNMAACAIDTAVRNAVAVGANLERLALLDNFCWCSSDEPERLGQLKRTAQACYDYAVAYGTPFISGKDSMFNDFEGFDERGEAIKISVPPTLLISSIGVMEDSRKAVSLDAVWFTSWITQQLLSYCSLMENWFVLEQRIEHNWKMP